MEGNNSDAFCVPLCPSIYESLCSRLTIEPKIEIPPQFSSCPIQVVEWEVLHLNKCNTSSTIYDCMQLIVKSEEALRITNTNYLCKVAESLQNLKISQRKEDEGSLVRLHMPF